MGNIKVVLLNQVSGMSLCLKVALCSTLKTEGRSTPGGHDSRSKTREARVFQRLGAEGWRSRLVDRTTGWLMVINGDCNGLIMVNHG